MLIKIQFAAADKLYGGDSGRRRDVRNLHCRGGKKRKRKRLVSKGQSFLSRRRRGRPPLQREAHQSQKGHGKECATCNGAANTSREARMSFVMAAFVRRISRNGFVDTEELVVRAPFDSCTFSSGSIAVLIEPIATAVCLWT